jgi:glycerol-3-phosphate cytidylyltransferase-like family protein
VDEVFVEESLELKREYVQKFNADVLVMGDDWAGKFDFLSDICEVSYLPRTPSISTTAVIEHISNMGQA